MGMNVMGVNLSSRPSKLAVPVYSWLVSSPISQGAFRTIGQFVVFTAQTLWMLPITVRRYRRQTLQSMNNLAWGRGSIIVDGGVISVLIILGIAIGGSVAIEAFSTLNLIGSARCRASSAAWPTCVKWHHWSPASRSPHRPAAA